MNAACVEAVSFNWMSCVYGILPARGRPALIVPHLILRLSTIKWMAKYFLCVPSLSHKVRNTFTSELPKQVGVSSSFSGN